MVRAGLALLGVALPAAAAAFDLGFPVACALGQTCYIQNHVDHDPGPGMADFACGGLGYDGHDGTDIALPTLAAMQAGVDVLAAAPGVVRGIRDEMADIAQGSAEAPDVTGRECGNGVAITHDGGWETQYCHMRLGSIRVRPGDRVAEGDVLGQIGLSGQTEFPHLHLTVRQGETEVDPFDPDGIIACGAPSTESLWADPPAYVAGGIIDAGWASAVPAYDAVRAGTAAEPIGADSPALVLFGLMFGGRAGDRVALAIDGPGGRILDHEEPLERAQALFFRAAGLRAPSGGWAAGEYTGTLTLLRDGAVQDVLTLPLTIGP